VGKYRPDIDGLRAVAVLSVLFYHAELNFYGGYVGVDVFFVISGYLITKILVGQLTTGSFRLSDFWMRRIRRLMPALAATTLVTGLLAYWCCRAN
jgi:peptidoglycan/LPS O-acetylase OafA/YrhL